MAERQFKKIAEHFMLIAVQEWGQTDEQRARATQSILDAAGFSVRATSKNLTGPDRIACIAWLRELLDTMPRGKFEVEVEHIEKMITARAAIARATA